MRNVVGWLAVLGLVLAGCVGHEDDAGGQPEVPRRSQEPAQENETLGFSNCEGWEAFYLADSAVVAPYLPNGYVGTTDLRDLAPLVPIVSDDPVLGYVRVLLTAWQCSTARANGTEWGDVRVAFVSVQLSQAKGQEDREGRDYYTLELFVSNAELGQELAKHGWNATVADIILDFVRCGNVASSARIVVGSETAYEASSPPAASAGREGNRGDHRYVVLPDGTDLHLASKDDIWHCFPLASAKFAVARHPVFKPILEEDPQKAYGLTTLAPSLHYEYVDSVD